MKSQLNEVKKLQKLAGILKEEVYQSEPFTKKLYDEVTELGISWRDQGKGLYNIHVEDSEGRELQLNIDEERQVINAITPGYKTDIPINDIGSSGEDIKNTLESLTDEFYQDNDPDYEWEDDDEDFDDDF